MPSRGQAFIATWGAWDTTNNKWKVGDAANQTAALIKDGAPALPTNPTITELSSATVNIQGVYAIALTSAETNVNTIWVGATSSSTAIYIVPTTYTMELLPVFALGANQGLITQGSGAGQMTMSSGFANVDVNQWVGLPPNALQGGLVQAAVLSGLVNSNVTTVLGQAVAAASGFLQVNSTQLVGIAPTIEADGRPLVAVISGAISTVLGNVNGNVTGSVGSVVAQVNANVQQVNAGNINNLISGRVDSITNQMGASTIQTSTFNAGALTTTVFATNFLTSALVDATQNNAAADALLDRANAIETGLTPRQAIRLEVATAVGVTSGALTAGFQILGAGVATKRVSAVTDQSGNRLAVTLTP